MTMCELFRYGGRATRKWRFMKAKTFDSKFDAAEKIVDHLDLSQGTAYKQGTQTGERGFSRLDGGLPGSGGTPYGCYAAVIDQTMACRQIKPEGCSNNRRSCRVAAPRQCPLRRLFHPLGMNVVSAAAGLAAISVFINRPAGGGPC
jgi:hypothetical protein